MTDERRLSTSDIAAADRHDAETAERERIERDRAERDQIERERQQGADQRPTDRDRAQLPEQQAWADAPTPLFANDELSGYRARWSAIQTGFVDEPRKAVEEADTLVAELMKRLAEVFAEERRGLEGHWERKDQVSTEDLRIAMRRYRSFFERLLSV
jgi:hypothetical protein